MWAMEESGADGGVVFLGRGHGWLLRRRCVLAVAEMAIVNFVRSEPNGVGVVRGCLWARTPSWAR